MRGFIEGTVRRNHVAEVEFFGQAIEILKWGRSIWKNVPKSQRGAIFEETFLFGARSLYLEAYVKVRPRVGCMVARNSC